MHVCPQNCMEYTEKTEPGEVVEALSMLKLESFLKSPKFKDDCTAVACDTLLWFDNKLIGKAQCEQEAKEQICMLLGQKHQVYSGYALYYKKNVYHGFDVADVQFGTLSSEKINEYIASKEWQGAAGSYHLFGRAVDFVKSVSGDVSTVIGLPLKIIEELIEKNDRD